MMTQQSGVVREEKSENLVGFQLFQRRRPRCGGFGSGFSERCLTPGTRGLSPEVVPGRAELD
jgi:hypothetical protein